MTKAAFFGHQGNVEQVYGQGRAARVAELCELYPIIITPENFAEHASQLQDLDVIFSTWGMPALTAKHVEKLPALKVVFYAAGTVQSFARPFLERDITVVSAWQANGVPVAEYTLAQILLATKGFFRNVQQCHTPEGYKNAFRGRGNYGETISILGAGAIGRKLIQLLQPFEIHILVFDPFLSDETAAALGVEKVSLDDAFARGYVVTNHLANNPQTRGLLHGGLFERLRPDATFINTGRGATVVEKELIGVLQARPDLTALLDVTDPEPPTPDSPLYSLPNAHLTSHIAGSQNQETVRMADYCIEEFLAWRDGKSLRYAVTLEMLETMA